jgi:hypothetical protein
MNQRSGKLSAERRHRVFEAYRGRGQRMNSLWLVYSVKIDRDWILTSDRQLVHWLCFLETDPTVRGYMFDPDQIESHPSVRGVLVNKYDGCEEIHEVHCGDSARARSRTVANGKNIPDVDVKRIRAFCDADLKPIGPRAMRWMKALAFAAALRDQQHIPLQVSMIVALEERHSGVVEDVVNALTGYELPIVLGMLVRLCIKRYIELDLNTISFCYQTPWRMREVCE